MMEPPKLLSFGEILVKVVNAKKCIGCSGCVAVCPVDCLEFVDGKPKLVKKCANCGICVVVCPQYEYSFPALEESVFGRQKAPGEEFGIYRRMTIAQASDEKILQKCQDGGVVTALLVYALEKGLIDGAAVSGVTQEKPFYPVPKLVTTTQEVLECAGTRYTYSPNLLAFREGINQGKKRLAFVGTPCQILALRKIEKTLFEHVNPLKLAVGLLCTECFTYDGLIEKHIQGKLGINLNDIEKINIKAKVLVTTKTEETHVIPLKEAIQYARANCVLCTDFSAELADISAGGLGLNGWTFTILRTKRGEELFERAKKEGIIKTRAVQEEQRALDLLVKLSQRKRKDSAN